jgi:hypothetical protein
MSKRYGVTVTREVIQIHHLQIDAEDEDAAMELATDELCDINDWEDSYEGYPGITQVIELEQAHKA